TIDNDLAAWHFPLHGFCAPIDQQLSSSFRSVLDVFFRSRQTCCCCVMLFHSQLIRSDFYCLASLRKMFGLLEKHNSYVIRVKPYHQNENIKRKLKQKTAFKNPYEIMFFREKRNKYNAEELMIIKTQDIEYVFQKWWSEKNKKSSISLYHCNVLRVIRAVDMCTLQKTDSISPKTGILQQSLRLTS
ncbi:unnamed protein product, partial [Thlaspi arvense]